MRIWALQLAIFGCWLTGLWAQPSPPLTFEDEEGTAFILVTDAQDKPVLVNGSALYQGIRFIGTDRIETYQTLASIQKKAMIKSWEQNPHSPWVRKGLELQVGGRVLEEFLSHFESHPADFRKVLSGTSDPKAVFLRSLLFSDEVILTKDDLIAIRTSARVPSPDPVAIRFPVEDKPWFADYTSEWFIQIAIEQLGFKFRKKLIRFDPLQNLIRVRLECNGAVLKGPTLSIGRVNIMDFYKYPIPFKDYIPFGFGDYLDEKRKHYWKVENELISGDVGPLILEVDLRFFNDSHGMWRIGLADKIRFMAEGEDPQVKLTYRDPVPTPDGPSTTQPLPLTAWAQNIIAETLTETLLGAFSSSIDAEELSRGIDINEIYPKKDLSHAHLQTRLSDFRVGRNSLNLVFDARVLSAKVAPCILTNLPHELPIRQSESLSLEAHYRDEVWNLERSAQTGGKWALAGGSGGSRVNFRVSAGMAEAVHLGLFLKGHYCASTAQWETRSGAIPKTEFSPKAIPKLSFGENAMEFEFDGELGFFGRTYEDRGERFQLMKTSPILFKPRIYLESDERSASVTGINSLQFPLMSPSENELIKEVLGDLLAKAKRGSEESAGSLVSGGLSLQESVDRMTENKVILHELSLSPQELRASLELRSRFYEDLFKDPPPPKPIPPYYREPVSVLSEKIPYVISDRFVSLNWKSPVGSPFFSWRRREFPSGEWTNWSEFDESLSTTFARPKPGKYEFQVKAMNLNYEIERIPSSIQFLVPEEERIRGDDDGTTQWTKPPSASGESQEKQQSAIPAPARASDRGLFGCSLTDRLASKDRFQILFWVLGLWLILSIVRWRAQRRLGRRDHPRFDEAHQS